MANPTHVHRLILDLRANWRGSPATLERRLHSYYLACCRRIWPLLPQQESRQGVELAERYLNGSISAADLACANYYVEGAAFNIEYNSEPERILQWIREVEALPHDELCAMVPGIDPVASIDARRLLLQAAYFADYAMMYQQMRRKEPWERYAMFFAPDLFREAFGDPCDRC